MECLHNCSNCPAFTQHGETACMVLNAELKKTRTETKVADLQYQVILKELNEDG